MTFLYQALLFGLPGACLALVWRHLALRGRLTALFMATTGGGYVFLTMTTTSLIFLNQADGGLDAALERGIVYGCSIAVVLYLGGRIMLKDHYRDKR